MSFDAGYCGYCGEYIGTAWFHVHDNLTVEKDPKSPYCWFCGKTLRLGFVPRVTCSCEGKEVVKP